MTEQKDKAISSSIMAECECCIKWKRCKMYVIATGEPAWICEDCRNGKPK